MSDFNWREAYKDRLMSPQEAAKLIKSGDVIASSMSSGVPYLFIDALAARGAEISGVKLYMAAGYKPYKAGSPLLRGRLDIVSAFLGPVERYFIGVGSSVSYQPVHLSDTTYDRTVGHRANVVAVAGARPNGDGMISLGPCPADAALLESCDTVIVQINENLPYVYGKDCMFPAERVTAFVDGTEDVPSLEPDPVTPEEEAIGALIAERIPDGACIQLGIGGLGTVVGGLLKDKRELGIHTEMFVESMAELVRCGAVTNSRKKLCPGKSVFGFASGSHRLYEFMDGNPDIEARPFGWVNDPRVICQNDNVVSVNAAMQVDLMGQVCAESIGPRQYSGTGGQADYVRGAKWSRGGMSFIALPSSRTDKTGKRFSKISCLLPLGSAVTTPRSDVQFIVTEYGVADLRNESLDVRARRLISIAHPDFREELAAEAKKAGLTV